MSCLRQGNGLLMGSQLTSVLIYRQFFMQLSEGAFGTDPFNALIDFKFFTPKCVKNPHKLNVTVKVHSERHVAPELQIL